MEITDGSTIEAGSSGRAGRK